MKARQQTSFLFDLDGTLVDSVYDHVLAWHDALQEEGIEVSVWRLHRKIGMSGGLFTKALARETGLEFGPEMLEKLRLLHIKYYGSRSHRTRPQLYRRARAQDGPRPTAARATACLPACSGYRWAKPAVDSVAWLPHRLLALPRSALRLCELFVVGQPSPAAELSVADEQTAKRTGGRGAGTGHGRGRGRRARAARARARGSLRYARRGCDRPPALSHRLSSF